MTEEEWLGEWNCAQTLMRFLLLPARLQRTKRGKRKLRLFSCACCRAVWEGINEPCRELVDDAELFADSRLSLERTNAARERLSVYDDNMPLSEWMTTSLAHCCWHRSASGAALESSMILLPLYGSLGTRSEADELHCHLLRDIFGNPFWPVSFNREWRTSTAVSIAKGMYESRDFSPMPILADALQEAGCENADILNHCRSGGPHVKGCWVVDLVLGKA